MLEIADLKADTINTIGNGEAQIADVMQSRRKYEYMNKKLDVVKAFKDNKNLKIFGDNQDDILSQMAAYRITDNKGGIHWISNQINISLNQFKDHKCSMSIFS